MCLQQNNRDEAYAQVQIKLNNRPGIHNLSAKIDTGAQGNTLSLRTFRRMYPDKLDADGFPVEHIVAAARYARLTAYNGTSIPCHGIVNIPCSYSNSAWNDTQFYIVDVTGPAVIGLQSSETLKLVTLHCTIKVHSSAEDASPTSQPIITNTAAINSVNDLARMYPQQLDRKCCFPGEVKLVVDPAVPPRVNPPRKTYLARFSDERIEELRTKTKDDHVLRTLSETIVTGWPETIKELPTSIRSYWSFRDELSVEDGILLKGTRVIIPESMQSFILDRLHYGHLGIEKTRLRAKDSVYWININRDIETTVKSCHICQEHRPAQQHETLLPHEVPSRPWEVVGTDMFFFNDADWLIIADYYSKFSIVRKMPRPCLSSSVVSVTKQIFSETGVPSRVVSDNGPHFASACYAELSKKMAFRHVTSSPRYPRSNGFIERQIQTVKHVMKKSRQSGQDLDLALLCLRTTPIDSKLPSPAELLNGRKAQSTLLTKIVDTRQDHDEMRERLQERQDNMVYQHDQHARDLPPLHNGQAVRFRDQDGRWKPATVLNKTRNPRSYIFATPSTSTIRRNRNHIRDNATQPVVKRVSFGSPTAVQPAFGSTTAVQPAFGSTAAVQPVPPVVYPTVPVETPSQRDRAVNDATTPVTTTNGSTENIVQSKENGQYVTRSGRHSKQPHRFS